MIDRALYDNYDLNNKIIIWFTRYSHTYKCFKVISQRIGCDGMSISGFGLYTSYMDDIFWKQDMDAPDLFVVKELYCKCTI